MHPHHDGYIIEYIQAGNSVKVTAIDPETMIEATIIGPTYRSQEELAKLAVQKLHYVLDKKRGD
jgi:hypothetical protein